MKKRGDQWDAVKDAGHTASERSAIRLAWGESASVGEFLESLDNPQALARLAVDLSGDQDGPLLTEQFLGIAMDCMHLVRDETARQIQWVADREGDALRERIPSEGYIGMQLRQAAVSAHLGIKPLAVSAVVDALLKEAGQRAETQIAAATLSRLGSTVAERIAAHGGGSDG